MANKQSPDSNEDAAGSKDLRQDPFVERRKQGLSQPPEPVRVLAGLLGDSDREGYRRLYFSRQLDSYAEFRIEDVVDRELIPANQAPFPGLDASRVSIRRDAPVWYTRVRTPRPVDEFDLDIRLGRGGRSGQISAMAETWEAECAYTYGCPQTIDCGGTHRLDTCYGPQCSTRLCEL